MVMGACPGQIPISYVPLTLMVTATMARACRYNLFTEKPSVNPSRDCLNYLHAAWKHAGLFFK